MIRHSSLDPRYSLIIGGSLLTHWSFSIIPHSRFLPCTSAPRDGTLFRGVSPRQPHGRWRHDGRAHGRGWIVPRRLRKSGLARKRNLAVRFFESRSTTSRPRAPRSSTRWRSRRPDAHKARAPAADSSTTSTTTSRRVDRRRRCGRSRRSWKAASTIRRLPGD